jgi:diaminohydroxyphosphoribosylaminopyrimidine deaminase/5-amino-6-(5-phosphoribosylamino)uracil reductase
LRAGADAIVTGIGTVLMDDPSLTVRVGAARSHTPLRIVLDPSLRIPLHAKVLVGLKASTLIVTTAAGPVSKRAALEKIGVEVLVLPAQRGRIQWKTLLSKLGQRGIASLLIEGGAEVNASVLRTGVVDRVLFFLAPRLLGGRAAIGAIGGMSPARLSEALNLKRMMISRVGLDILVEGYLR